MPFVAIAAVSFLSQYTVISAESLAYQSTGSVGFVPSNEGTKPFNPNEPTPEEPVNPIGPDGEQANPGTAGPLSLDFASSFFFGNRKITNQDVVYKANAQALANQDGTITSYVPNYIQVTDNRGNNAGWTLNVSQTGQLRSTKATTNGELKGAMITLKEPVSVGLTNSMAPKAHEVTLDPNGAKSIVMSAEAGTGSGTWITRWGSQGDLMDEEQSVLDKQSNSKLLEKENVTVSPAVTLSIPGKTPRDAVRYTTTLNWILTNIPITVK
jgi:hypothetical protein